MPFLDQVFGDHEGESLMNTGLADHLDDSTCWDFSIRRFESIMDPATAGIGVHPWDRAGAIDPDDCPNLMDPADCPELVDLWFELVDAGYTEDEAFEMIEMVMDWAVDPDRSTKQDTIN
jgi:hypothetical protein